MKGDIMEYINFGTEVIKGLVVASFPYENKEDAYDDFRKGNWPSEVYQVRCYQGKWYIMAKK